MSLSAQITQAVQTKAEGLHLLHDLELLVSKRIFHGKKAGEEEEFEKHAFFQKLPEDFFDEFNENNLDFLFRQAEKELGGTEEITLYTSNPLDDEERLKIGKKIREDFGKKIFIDFRVDPKLIGGCALVWQGKYYDYSIKGKWGEIEKIIREKLN